MPPMEIVRQNDVQTNGDIEQSDTPVDDSPQHVNSDSVNMINKIFIKQYHQMICYFFFRMHC